MNMFTFKLESNDSINIKSSKKLKKMEEDKNYFSSCSPNNISENQTQTDYFSNTKIDNR